MKVRALASISGPMGRKALGDEFTLNAADAKDLVDRKLVEVVEEAPAKPKKESKAEA
jgi:hypothetical protein